MTAIIILLVIIIILLFIMVAYTPNAKWLITRLDYLENLIETRSMHGSDMEKEFKDIKSFLQEKDRTVIEKEKEHSKTENKAKWTLKK